MTDLFKHDLQVLKELMLSILYIFVCIISS